MQIEIKNFGPIKEFTFDLEKDLHLIFGENAIGKSYAVYCIYDLIKAIQDKIYSLPYRFDLAIEKCNELAESLIKNVKKKEISLSKHLEKLTKEFTEIVFLEDIKNSLLSTFSFLSISNKKSFSIKIKFSSGAFITILSGRKQIEIGEINIAHVFVSYKIKKQKDFYQILQNDEIINQYESSKDFISQFGYFFAQQIIYPLLYNFNIGIKDVYFLPASRSGLYQALGSLTPIIAELTTQKFFLKNKKIELPSLPEPVADYFTNLSLVNKRTSNSEYDVIIDKIEKEILEGSITYNEMLQKITFKSIGLETELELSDASSMISELAPIVIFLKYVINNKKHKVLSESSYTPYLHMDLFEYAFKTKNMYNIDHDIIFIEEPEAHLHPKLQIKLMEIFAELTSKHKIKIVMTSHSNYMFNKLGNLIIGNKVDSQKVKVYHLIKTLEGSIVSDDMKVTSDGIDDYNFADVSQELYEERMRLYELQNP